MFLCLIPVLWMAPRPWPWNRIAGIVAAVWVIIGFSVDLQAHERLGQGVVQEDRSISNPLELWKYAPAMMLDAPGGWGIGKPISNAWLIPRAVKPTSATQKPIYE